MTTIRSTLLKVSLPLSAFALFNSVLLAEDLSDLSLDELLEVSVATRDRQALITAPANVTVFTREDIEQLGIVSIQELLNLVPGFLVTRDVEQGTAERIAVRGRSTALSESVLFLIDGQRINDLYSGGVSLLNRVMAIDHVAQVEVIRGPGSALYGSNAFLGVVNIITRKSGNDLKLRAGTFGHYSASLFTSGQIKDQYQWSVYFATINEQGENYRLTDAFGVQQATDDPVSGNDFYSSLAFAGWDFDFRYMDRQLDNFLVFGNHGANQEETEQWSISAEFHTEISAKVNLRFHADIAGDRWNTRATLIPAGVEFAPGEVLANDFFGGPLLESQERSLALDATWLPASGHSVLIGAVWQEAEISDVANVTTHNPITLDYFGALVANRDALNFLERRRRDIKSIYTQYQWQISQGWELTSGARLDDYSDFGSSLNPRMALVYQPSTNSSVKLLYATAFRAPNFLELYDKNNPVDFGNSALAAEEVKTSEISWLQRRGAWHLELNYFHNAFDNLIILGDVVVDADNPLLAPSFTNGSSGSNSGLEAVLGFRLHEGLNMELIATRLNQSSFMSMPNSFATVRISQAFESISWSVTGQWVHQSSAHQHPSDFQRWSAHLRYQLSEPMSLALSVKNAFDEDYLTYSSVLPNGVANRGRQWLLEASYYY
ncbi:MAG: TonB-dependent receptor [Gammaproteobacteria bacterium]|nr:TonB-dependent receptor [Gammaproteobacteria bacterium]